MRDRLSDVRWLGGGSGAGKSTIAGRLAESFGLRVYSTDESIQAHLARTTSASHPLLHAFSAMTMDERWLKRSPAVMLETFHGFQGEAFELIVEDVLALPSDRPVLVEGFRLLPRLVAPLLSRADRAVWLLPTPGFRQAAFESRGTTWQIAGRTSDPETSLQNLLRRDALFTDDLGAEVDALELSSIRVDVGMDLGGTTELTRRALGLGEPPASHIL